MSKFGVWRKVTKDSPHIDQRILGAYLTEYVNARWVWGIHENWRNEYGWHVYGEPNFWMPFPDPPELTAKQKAESEGAFQKAKREKIEGLEKELEELKQCK